MRKPTKRIEQVKKLKAKAAAAAAAEPTPTDVPKVVAPLTPTANRLTEGKHREQNAFKHSQVGSGNLPVGRSSARKPGG